MKLYVIKYKKMEGKRVLVVLTSGNVIDNSQAGIYELNYLNKLKSLLEIDNQFQVLFFKYPKRKTKNSSTNHFINNSVKILQNELKAIMKKESNTIISLLGISIGGGIILKYLDKQQGIKIDSIISIGLFIHDKQIIKNSCNKIHLIYGSEDVVNINYNNVLISLDPKEYAEICRQNIVSKNNISVVTKIIKNRTHTLLNSNNPKQNSIAPIKRILNDSK